MDENTFYDSYQILGSRTMSSVKPPKPLVVNSDIDMSQEWTEWLELYDSYFIANKINDETATIQVANFKACAGRDALKILANLSLTDAERANIKTIKEKLTNHFAPSKNKTYERCQFHRIKQQKDENFEDFLQKLKTQVKKCSYNNNEDEFVMDQIVVGLQSDITRQKLWTEDELDLEKTKKICRAAERAMKQISELQNVSEQSTFSVHEVSESIKFDCRRCGSKHGPRSCQAFGRRCNNCDRMGHFAARCKSKKTTNGGDKRSKENQEKRFKKKDKRVNTIDTDSDSDSECYQVGAIRKMRGVRVNAINNDDKWSEKLKISDKTVIVKLDTGADCNVLSEKEAARLNLRIEKTNTKRIMSYSNNSVTVVGQTRAKCETKNGTSEVIFKIVAGNYSPILGKRSCEQMGLVARVDNVESTEKIAPRSATTKIKTDDKLGCCKNFSYDIDFIDDAKFKIIPPRKIAHALRDQVKAELHKMVKMGVIRPVSKPTPAVSPIVVVNKGGKIRLCMDPTELNKNIKRRHYPLKTVEEVAARAKGAKYYTKLDCLKGFCRWQ